MMIRISHALLFVSLLLFAPAVATAQQGLRWQFAEGERYEIGISQRGVSFRETNLFGPGDADLFSLTLFFDCRVVAVDQQDAATLELTFERILVHWKQDQSDWVHIDTSHAVAPTEETRAASAAVESLLGKKLQIVLTSRGEIERFTYVDFSSEVFDQAETESVLSNFQERSLEKLFDRCLPVLPEQAGEAPETWSSEIGVALSPVDSVHEVEFTRSELETEEAAENVIDFRADPVGTRYEITDFSGENTRFDPARRVSVSSQETEGSLRFDLAAGRLLSCTLRQRTHYAEPNQNGQLREVGALTMSDFVLWPLEED